MLDTNELERLTLRPNPLGGVPVPPSRGLGAWLGKGGPIFPSFGTFMVQELLATQGNVAEGYLTRIRWTEASEAATQRHRPSARMEAGVELTWTPTLGSAEA